MGTPPLDTLLLDAECRQTLTAMRAYARRGLPVGALASHSDAWWAPALRSRWCSFAAEVPDYTVDARAYVDGVLAAAEESGAQLLLPAHDGSIEALRARRDEVERAVPLALASEPSLNLAVSKARTLDLAASLGIATPRGVPVAALDDVAEAVREVGLPAVIKPVQSWVGTDGEGVRLSSEAVQSVDEAKRTMEWVLGAGGQALVQQWLPGLREAVTMMYADGEVRAQIAQVSHREWPALGGVSVLCETIPLLPDITADADRLVRAMDLEGCSMVEFRRDVEGRPVLMEVNPRMGGSVALCLQAGVDIPMLVRAWALSLPLPRVTGYRTGQRMRWLAGDIWNLKCVFDSQGRPDIPPRGRATARFLVDFARPGNTLDVFDRSDIKPALAEMNKVVFRHAARRVQRLPGVRRLSRG
jgi:predicted ATP-grasp superfamily ATP-dependent carboligase